MNFPTWHIVIHWVSNFTGKATGILRLLHDLEEGVFLEERWTNCSTTANQVSLQTKQLDQWLIFAALHVHAYLKFSVFAKIGGGDNR